MPFAYADLPSPVSRPAVILFGRYNGVPYREAVARPFAVTRVAMRAIHFGQTVYPLRLPAEGAYAPTPAGGEFLVEGFHRLIVGTGRTPDEAQRDWRTRFHAAFQALFVKHKFEMCDAERSLWSVIEAAIDLDAYRAGRPVVVLQQGKVKRARPYPDLIEWEDGTTERVRLDRMPAEFVTFKAGQRFEAMAHRSPASHKLLKVDYVKRLAAHPLDEGEARAIWDAASSSAGLPDTDWS